MEIEPTAHLSFLTYTDRPGIVGIVGRILGERSINIASMQVARDVKGGKALIALTVDSAHPGRRASSRSAPRSAPTVRPLGGPGGLILRRQPVGLRMRDARTSERDSPVAAR